MLAIDDAAISFSLTSLSAVIRICLSSAAYRDLVRNSGSYGPLQHKRAAPNTTVVKPAETVKAGSSAEIQLTVWCHRSLLATLSLCFMPFSCVALAAGLSCIHTLQYSHQCIGLDFQNCRRQTGLSYRGKQISAAAATTQRIKLPPSWRVLALICSSLQARMFTRMLSCC